MRIFNDIRQSKLDSPTVLTIGNFDGVHLGHQALLDLVMAEAEDYAQAHPQAGPVNTGLITFDPHPLAVLRPTIPLQLLTTAQERLDLAAAQGLTVGFLHPFDMATARLSPRAFMTLLVENLGMVRLITGPDFALGRDRTGDLGALTLLGEELGYTIVTLPPLDWRGESVRSRVIRELLSNGDVERAARRLGRAYTVTGPVTRGDGRGQQIGVPTANVAYPPHKLLPGDGVYVTRTRLAADGTTFNSVTNVGVRPTVDGLHHKIETHLLDFPPQESDQSGDLYGQTITVEFLQRLRGEKRFAGVTELVAQIQADVRSARQVFQRLDEF